MMHRHVFETLTFLILATLVVAKKYCKQDSDCDSMGKLYCIKSACDWGVCSCPRGKAAKYLGSEKQYRCVSVKKVGEKCSNDGDKGVCGAPGSYCHEEDGKCKCKSGVPIWGGEKCAASDTALAGAGETCAAGSMGGTGGTCNDGTTCVWSSNSGYMHGQVDVYDLKPTCACANTQTLHLPNWYEPQVYIEKKDPSCITTRVGEMCLKNSDCPGNTASNSPIECKDNTCQCTGSNVPNYKKTGCAPGLSHGAKCHTTGGAAIGSHCDGSKGLVCGDMCSFDDVANEAANVKCACGPYHTTSGSTCNLIGDGGACKGDLSCKGFSMNGICVDGTCRDGAELKSLAVTTLLMSVLVAYFAKH